MLFERLLEMHDPEPHEAALNMAIDEVLLRTVAGPLLRVYRWARPAVSLGYFDRIEEAETMAEGRDLVRRWTGGGLVEHGHDLTYTLIVPREHPLCTQPAAESYRAIHEALVPLLRGVRREITIAPSAQAKISAACFANPVQYDLVAGQEKLAGAAQRRTRWGLLHQGSIQGSGLPQQLNEQLAEALGGEMRRLEITDEVLVEAAQLTREKYGAVSWLRKF